VLRRVEPDDLIQYGLIPELVGRIPAVFGLDELDEDALLRVLTEPKNSLVKQYKKLFALEGVRLTFAQDGLRRIVQMALAKKTGARGLRNSLECVLVPIMFDLPSRDDVVECLITRDVVDGGIEPVLTLREKKKIA
jgi:ATP-dependent Clp protease ATP-binding subunit ClpX